MNCVEWSRWSCYPNTGTVSPIKYVIRPLKKDLNSYYNETLYPLQDKILGILDHSDLPFYLTGGTALHRGYYGVRYSDDLDFFVNKHPEFETLKDQVLSSFDSLDFTVEHRSPDFLRFTVQEILQVDFVNDVPAYLGETVNSSLFSKLDNPRNILANKLCSLTGRDEPKDVIDIWVINRENDINWKETFTGAQSKAAGVFPPAVARKIDQMPDQMLDRIKLTDSSYRDRYLEERNQLIESILSIDES